ncbi:MAG: VOC family protein [Longimicrobiales bacterium]|nr:VOC family protein [Longimicrobiales bacterium]
MSIHHEARPGRVRLQVADLDRSLDYYRQVLGLDVLEDDGARTLLGVTETAEPLVELHERPGAAAVPPRGRLGLFHFAILLPDRRELGAFLRHLSDAGVAIGASDHRVSEALYLRDPDGLGIEVYADRPRQEWRYRGEELVMTTEPLDRQGLLDAAADREWAGVPAETTMGHVHLHVGDLDEADAFYHGAVGLEPTVWSYPGALFLSAGGYHHHLGLNTWAAGAPPARQDEARLLDWTLVLPSPEAVERTRERAEAAGRGVSGDAETAILEDPWGTRLRVTVEP